MRAVPPLPRPGAAPDRGAACLQRFRARGDGPGSADRCARERSAASRVTSAPAQDRRGNDETVDQDRHPPLAGARRSEGRRFGPPSRRTASSGERTGPRALRESRTTAHLRAKWRQSLRCRLPPALGLRVACIEEHRGRRPKRRWCCRCPSLPGRPRPLPRATHRRAGAGHQAGGEGRLAHRVLDPQIADLVSSHRCAQESGRVRGSEHAGTVHPDGRRRERTASAFASTLAAAPPPTKLRSIAR